MLNCFVFHIMCYVNNIEVKTYNENRDVLYIMYIVFGGETPDACMLNLCSELCSQ